MTYQEGNVLFTLELLTACLVILFSAPKRKHFWLRLPAAYALCALITWLIPMQDEIFHSLIGTIVKNLGLMCLCIAGMSFCFELPFSGLFSACVSGYAIQHIGYQIFTLIRHFSWAKAILENGPAVQFALEISVMILTFIVCLLTLGCFVARHRCYEHVDRRIVLIAFFIILIGIGLRRVTQYFDEWESITIPLYAITSCLLSLTIQYILFMDLEKQRENDTIRLMWQEERKQFQISKENQELLHIKYHDWKHQLMSFQNRISGEEITRMENAMKIQDGTWQTGNEALDVVLTQFHWRCVKRKISMNFTGGGNMLPTMDVTDIYSLFGNAIENAMEAVEQVQDPEKRVVDIFMERKGAMTIVDVSNYYSGTINMEEGLPMTSKAEEGFHGYGVKSMKQIVKKYEGEMSIETEGDVFHLRFWILDTQPNEDQ